MPYETVSPDDAHSILYGTSPKAEITVQPTVQESKTPVAPPKKAKEQEKKNEGVAPTTSLAQQVTNTMDVLKDNTPAPIPASPVTPMTNTIGDLLTSVRDNWLPVVAPVLGYGAYKLGKSMVDGEPKPAIPTTPISDRQITRIEPKMDVNQQPSSGRIEPTFSDPVPTQPNVSISPEVTSSTGYTGLAQLEEKHGVQFTGGNDLRTVLKGENNTAIKGGQEPPYPHLLSPEAQQKLAQEKAAGVTPTTSAPEAQTLVATREASLDPVEKAQEKVTFAEPSKEIKGAVIPKSASKIKEVPEGMSLMEGAAGPTNWMYNTHKGRYNSIINEFNNGQHPKTMEEAYALDKMFKAKYGGLSRGPNIPTDVAIERGIPAPEPGGRLGKVVSHAGKLGILASIADIANAAQSNKKGDLKETLYEIAKNLTVPSALGLHTGGLNTNEERELAQRRKIGGGRGVAPAGMGQR